MSKKTRRELAIPDLKAITITQSNRVTNAKYDYTLIQERVFTYIMYNLQYEITQVMNGTHVTQLSIFRDLPSDVLCMTIPLHDLGIPSQYPIIRDAILRMSSVSIRLKTVTKNTLSWSGLFSKVTMPNQEEGKRSSMVTIEMRRDVSQALIDVHYNKDRPEQYTKFMLYVALKSQQKYTSKIYKLLCSYAKKGLYSCTVDELREHLMLDPGMYANFAHFKNRILVPVSEELKAIADIYFDPNEKFFTESAGRKVVRLNFKIHYPLTEEMYKRQCNNFLMDLARTFGCKESHLARIVPLLHPGVNWNDLEAIRNKCYHLCNTRQVDYPAAHITRSIIALLTEV